MAQPEEIAAAGCYFVSDGVKFTTSQALAIESEINVAPGTYGEDIGIRFIDQ